jgi:hypothetical protein
VAEFCTCGAELPPDARFCHKCGKPQREEPLLTEEPAAAPPAVPLPQTQPVLRIGFGNPLAFRIGFLSALLSLLLTLLVMPAWPVWLVAAGFLGVYLYQRRSGEPFSTRNGAKMGWITGVLSFFVFSLPLTLAFIQEITGPDYISRMRQQMAAFAFPSAMQEQTIAFLQTPLGIAGQVFMLLAMLFVLLTVFPLLGGVLAAKVLGKKQVSS